MISHFHGHSSACTACPPAHAMSHTPPSSAEAGTAASSASPGTPAFSPLYQQIKGLILQSLQAGEWKPGEDIPSEMELAARFRVSQGTVRKAIDELAAEHLVVRRQGKGTFVASHNERHVEYRFLRLYQFGNIVRNTPCPNNLTIMIIQGVLACGKCDDFAFGVNRLLNAVHQGDACLHDLPFIRKAFVSKYLWIEIRIRFTDQLLLPLNTKLRKVFSVVQYKL